MTTATASMFVDHAIHFTNPFAPKDPKLRHGDNECDSTTRTSWSAYPRCADFSRALTPPPDMNGGPQSSRPTPFQQEHVHHYGDRLPSQQASHAPVAPYLPQEVPGAHFGHRGVAAQSSRPSSPIHFATVDQAHEPQSTSQQRRPSQGNAIAVNFQIPRSVNDSGGSLSELAAQITCLFWFESSDLLQQIEDSPGMLHPLRPLTADAKPTTGFRKWVTTILSTTCVAQNVVLLALLFIHRLKKLNPSVKGKPGSEYRLLTVALMLGNKFLDDNTYTNKTWAEVSGINVEEVHIMEVEFLSNMKYCLFTSEQDWAKWQSLLGKFSTFFDRASRPLPPAPILPPASSLYLPMALPSPPSSVQTSPPYGGEIVQAIPTYTTVSQHNLTPAPSPLGVSGESSVYSSQSSSRKRSLDDYVEPPPKRIASIHQNYPPQHPYAALSQQQPGQGPAFPRLPLPNLSVPASQASLSITHHTSSQPQQQQQTSLGLSSRSMGMVYPSSNPLGQMSQSTALSAPTSRPLSQSSQQYTRLHSPYGTPASASPTSVLPLSATVLPPPTQVSPSYYLQQRNSPYRPVHNVSTLLYPPPSTAMQHRTQHIELNQMHYQPLGKQYSQSGKLPYVAQNIWVDGAFPQEMTPVHQWPGLKNVPLPAPTKR